MSIVKNKICLIVYNYVSNGLDPDAEGKETGADFRTDVKDIRKALKERGCEVKTLGLGRISSKMIGKIEDANPDFIFNLCEGLRDRSQTEMYVAGVFELLKIPYTGSPPLALGLGLNKMKTKQIFYSKGIPTPKFVVALPNEPFSLNSLTPPYIVKPVREDGSAGISIDSVVNEPDLAMEKVNYIHQTRSQPALIEEFIDGREFSVAVLGDEGEKVVVIGEVDFSQLPKGAVRILSYEAKWNLKSPLYIGTPITYPTDVGPHLKAKVDKIAVSVFDAIGCRDYARIDMRISDRGRIYVLEINPNPDISVDSGMGKAAKAIGMEYLDLIEKISGLALARAKK